MPAEFQPFAKLFLAILTDALNLYRDQGLACAHPESQRHRRWREARDWIFDAGMRPFSFDWICCGLGLDPSRLRAGIRKPRDPLI